MSFSAQLIIDGTEMPILSSNIHATSGANPGYSSIVIPRDCKIKIVVAGYHSELFGWMVAPDLMKEGIIRFSSRDGMSRSINFEFWDCYCVDYSETFKQYSSSPATTEIILSPAIVRFRDEVMEKSWKVTNINAVKATAPSSHKEAAYQDPTPKEEKQPFVEKVEGPFTEDGKLVEEMLAGNTYVFRATQISESSHDPYPLIKWASETGDSGELEILPASGLFKEKEIISYKYTPKAGEKARVYAYCQSADKKVSVEVPLVCFPFCVDRFRMPGINNEGDNIAKDLTYGTGMFVVKDVYPPSVIESYKTTYTNNETFSLATLSNKNDAFSKAFYKRRNL